MTVAFENRGKLEMEPKRIHAKTCIENGLTAQSKAKEQLLLGKGTKTGLYTERRSKAADE